MLTTNINIQDQLINDQMTLLFDKIMLYLYSEPQRTTVSSQRVLFPVSLAWTCTVHKVQGLTLDKVQGLTLEKVQVLISRRRSPGFTTWNAPWSILDL